ncbi:hypothetical protein EU522_00545 [Candidatus Thorarchaeota archaeon]|nr:MAG: hypothetical protein EU522_00545 [Candidatus Thorarchaeota archaeon]
MRCYKGMESGVISLHATIEIPLDSPELAGVIHDALRPETDSAPSDRARVKVTARASILLLEITAEDLTALRAATNSYLAWISGCVRAAKSVTGQNP